MNTKRSKLEIYIDILTAISKGTQKPTRIMYRTNLSWKPLTKILESLIAQGLIIREDGGKHSLYEVTEKGRNVLRYFKEAVELITIE